MAPLKLVGKPVEYAAGISIERGNSMDLALSPSGLVAYPYKTNIVVSDINNLKQPAFAHQAHKNYKCASFSADGNLLACGLDNGIEVYNTDGWTVKQSYENTGSVSLVKVTSDSNCVISGSKASADAVVSYSLSTGKAISSPPQKSGLHGGGIMSKNDELVAFSEKLVMYAFSAKKTVKGLAEKNMKFYVKCGLFVGPSDSPSKFVVPDDLSTIKMFHFDGMKPGVAFTSEKQSNTFGFCKPDFNDNLFASVHSLEKCIRLWDIEKQKVLYKKPLFTREGKGHVGDMPVSAVWHQDQILVATNDGTFKKFDARSARTIETVQFEDKEEYHFHSSMSASFEPVENSNAFLMHDNLGNAGKWTLNSQDPSLIESFTPISEHKDGKTSFVYESKMFDNTTAIRARAGFVQQYSMSPEGKETKAQDLFKMNIEYLTRVDSDHMLAVDKSDHKIVLILKDKVAEPETLFETKQKDQVTLKYMPQSKKLIAFAKKMFKVFKVEISPKFKLDLDFEIKKVEDEILDISLSPDENHAAMLKKEGFSLHKVNESFEKLPGTRNPISTVPVKIAWNPEPGSDTIAVSYMDGSIGLTNAFNKYAKPLQMPRDHNSCITHLYWISQGVLLAGSNNFFRTYQISS